MEFPSQSEMSFDIAGAYVFIKLNSTSDTTNTPTNIRTTAKNTAMFGNLRWINND